MAKIGSFTKSADGSFIGEVVTLSVQAKNVRINPDENRADDKSPSHIITVGRAEIGSGWAKISSDGCQYIDLILDDPSFIAPIYGKLFESADGKSYSLIWTRPLQRDGE